MTMPVILSMPEDTAELASWLELKLVGTELSDLVAELVVVGKLENNIANLSIDEFLNSELAYILEHGLSRLERHHLKTLVQKPHLLLELRDKIHEEGGEYWIRKAQTSVELSAVQQSWRLLEQQLEDTTVNSPLPKRAADSLNSRRSWLNIVGFTSAAALVVGLYLLQQPEKKPAWDWQSGSHVASLRGKTFLEHLAETAILTKDNVPSSKRELERFLEAFRDDCQALIENADVHLEKDKAEKLKAGCQKWLTAMDSYANELDAGAKPEDVREKTIDKLETMVQKIELLTS